MAVGNQAKYEAVFSRVFNRSADQVASLAYRAIPEWDSARQMELVAALEAEFGVALDPDDILDLQSFEKGRQILSQKFGVAF